MTLRSSQHKYEYDTHVRFDDEQSVFYWTFVFGCIELTLRDAAAAVESCEVERLRRYFDFYNPSSLH